MIIDNLEEFENIKFNKVFDESNYVKKIYNAFIEVVDLLKKTRNYYQSHKQKKLVNQ